MSKLLEAAKEMITAITKEEYNKAMGALINAVQEEDPDYFITAQEYLRTL